MLTASTALETDVLKGVLFQQVPVTPVAIDHRQVQMCGELDSF